MNTGASAMKNITYNYVDMNFTDRFVINQPYQFDNLFHFCFTEVEFLFLKGLTKVLFLLFFNKTF